MSIAIITAVAGGERVRYPPGQSVDLTFNVTNTSDSPARFSLEPRPQADTAADWVELVGPVEIDLPGGGSRQVAVRLQVPEAASGQYSFSLRAYATDDPEKCADSPGVVVEVPASPHPAPEPDSSARRFPRWILVAAVIAVLAVAGGLTYWLWPEAEMSPMAWGQTNWDAATWQ